jgi:hypothetical protein
MQAKDNSHDWPKFKNEIYILDKLRGEKFWQTFTEMGEFKNYE